MVLAISLVVASVVIGFRLSQNPPAVGATITTYAGNGIPGSTGDGGPATEAELAPLTAVATDTSRNLSIAAGNAIRRVSASGIITTVAGSGFPGYEGDGGSATQAKFLLAPLGLPAPGAHGMVVDDQGNLYVRTHWPLSAVASSNQTATPHATLLHADKQMTIENHLLTGVHGSKSWWISVRRNNNSQIRRNASEANSQTGELSRNVTACDSGSGDRGFKSFLPSHSRVSGHG